MLKNPLLAVLANSVLIFFGGIKTTFSINIQDKNDKNFSNIDPLVVVNDYNVLSLLELLSHVTNLAMMLLLVVLCFIYRDSMLDHLLWHNVCSKFIPFFVASVSVYCIYICVYHPVVGDVYINFKEKYEAYRMSKLDAAVQFVGMLNALTYFEFAFCLYMWRHAIALFLGRQWRSFKEHTGADVHKLRWRPKILFMFFVCIAFLWERRFELNFIHVLVGPLGLLMLQVLRCPTWISMLMTVLYAGSTFHTICCQYVMRTLTPPMIEVSVEWMNFTSTCYPESTDVECFSNMDSDSLDSSSERRFRVRRGTLMKPDGNDGAVFGPTDKERKLSQLCVAEDAAMVNRAWFSGPGTFGESSIRNEGGAFVTTTSACYNISMGRFPNDYNGLVRGEVEDVSLDVLALPRHGEDIAFKNFRVPYNRLVFKDGMDWRCSRDVVQAGLPTRIHPLHIPSGLRSRLLTRTERLRSDVSVQMYTRDDAPNDRRKYPHVVYMHSREFELFGASAARLLTFLSIFEFPFLAFYEQPHTIEDALAIFFDALGQGSQSCQTLLNLTQATRNDEYDIARKIELVATGRRASIRERILAFAKPVVVVATLGALPIVQAAQAVPRDNMWITVICNCVTLLLMWVMSNQNPTTRRENDRLKRAFDAAKRAYDPEMATSNAKMNDYPDPIRIRPWDGVLEESLFDVPEMDENTHETDDLRVGANADEVSDPVEVPISTWMPALLSGVPILVNHVGPILCDAESLGLFREALYHCLTGVLLYISGNSENSRTLRTLLCAQWLTLHGSTLVNSVMEEAVNDMASSNFGEDTIAEITKLLQGLMTIRTSAVGKDLIRFLTRIIGGAILTRTTGERVPDTWMHSLLSVIRGDSLAECLISLVVKVAQVGKYLKAGMSFRDSLNLGDNADEEFLALSKEMLDPQSSDNPEYIMQRIMKLRDVTEVAYKTTQDKFVKSVLLSRFKLCNTWVQQWLAVFDVGREKIEPWPMTLTGVPKIGKTYAVANLVNLAHEWYRAEFGEVMQVVGVQNSCDAYDSNLTNATSAIIMNDLCYKRADMMEVLPGEILQRYVDSIVTAYVKAAVEDKGMHRNHAKFVFITSNVFDAGARYGISEPDAGTRRLGTLLEMKLKPEYLTKENVPDVASFPDPEGGLPKQCTYDAYYIKDGQRLSYKDANGKPMYTNMEAAEALHYVRKRFREHFQKAHYQPKPFKLCSKCQMPINNGCSCASSNALFDKTTDSLVSLDRTLQFIRWGMDSDFVQFVASWFQHEDRRRIARQWRRDVADRVFRTIPIVRLVWYVSSITLRATFEAFTGVTCSTKEKAQSNSKCALLENESPGVVNADGDESVRSNVSDLTNDSAKTTQSWMDGPDPVGYLVADTWSLLSDVVSWFTYLMFGAYFNRLLSNTARRFPYAKTACLIGAVTIPTLYAIWRLQKLWLDRKKLVGPMESIISNAIMGERVALDDKLATLKEEKPWAPVVRRPLERTPVSATTSLDDIARACCKNICKMRALSNQERKSHATFIQTGYLWYPSHFWLENEESIDIELECKGAKVKTTLFRETTVFRLNKDTAVSSCPGVFGDRYNLSKFLCADKVSPGHVVTPMLCGGNSPEYTHTNVDYVGKHVVSHCDEPVDVFAYASSWKKGDCGLPVLYGDSKCGMIVGFHVAHFHTPRCAAVTLTKDEWTSIKQEFLHKRGVITMQPLEEFHENPHVPRSFDNPIHPKSCVNFIPSDLHPVVETLGDIGKDVTFEADTEIHPHKEVFAKYITLPDFVPADLKHGNHVMREMVGVSYDPGPLVDQRYVNVAAEAALIRMKEAIDTVRDAFAKTELGTSERATVDTFVMNRPYTYHEVLNGIPGNPHAKGLVMSTSAGEPYRSLKSNWVEGDPGSRRFTDAALYGIATYEKRIRDGLRGGTVMRASLKDEGRKPEKALDPRVYQCGSMDALVVVNKYFGPMFAALTCVPSEACCAVGVSSHGTSWDQMMRPILTGEGECLEFDVKRFDQTAPLQLRVAAFEVLAEALCYFYDDWSDKEFFEALLSDVLTPVVSVYGALVELRGLMPSGHRITTPAGGKINEVGVGTSYAEMRHKEDPKVLDDKDALAREIVEKLKMGTLGDDFGGKTKNTKFNQFVIANTYDQFGMKITAGSKTDVIAPFTDKNDLEFLKRHTRFCKELQHLVGRLQTSSVLKPLTILLRSRNVTLMEQVQDQVDASLLEALMHGEKGYSNLQKAIKAAMSDIGYPMRATSLMSYHERLRHHHGEIHICSPGCDCVARLSGGMRCTDEDSDLSDAIIMATSNSEVDGLTTIPDVGTQVVSTPHDISPGFAFTEGASARSMDREYQLATLNVPIDTPYEFSYNMYDLFAIPYLKNRLVNVHGIKFDVELRLLVSGSSAHFGGLLLSSMPMKETVDFQNETTLSDDEKLMLRSSRPHAIVHIGTNENEAKLEVPLVFPLPTVSPYGTSTPTRRMCPEVSIMTITPIQHAYGSVTPVQCTLFGRLINVQTTGPTAVSNVKEVIEPVSSKLSAVSTVLNHSKVMFSSAPQFALLAELLSDVAGFGAKVARRMGYSKCIKIGSSASQVVTASSLCTADVDVTGDKLSVFHDQGVAVANLLKGGEEDPLSFDGWLKDYSIGRRFTWNVTDPVDTILLKLGPNPMWCIKNGNRLTLSKSAMVASQNEFWHGTVRYKITIFAPMMYGGKLLLSHEPDENADDATIGTATNVTRVVDIKHEREIYIDVGWTVNDYGLRTTEMAPDITNATDGHKPGYTQGEICIRVLQSITTMMPTSIAIYGVVSMCMEESTLFWSPVNCLSGCQVYNAGGLSEPNSTVSTVTLTGVSPGPSTVSPLWVNPDNPNKCAPACVDSGSAPSVSPATQTPRITLPPLHGYNVTTAGPAPHVSVNITSTTTPVVHGTSAPATRAPILKSKTPTSKPTTKPIVAPQTLKPTSAPFSAHTATPGRGANVTVSTSTDCPGDAQLVPSDFFVPLGPNDGTWVVDDKGDFFPMFYNQSNASLTSAGYMGWISTSNLVNDTSWADKAVQNSAVMFYTIKPFQSAIPQYYMDPAVQWQFGFAKQGSTRAGYFLNPVFFHRLKDTRTTPNPKGGLSINAVKFYNNDLYDATVTTKPIGFRNIECHVWVPHGCLQTWVSAADSVSKFNFVLPSGVQPPSLAVDQFKKVVDSGNYCGLLDTGTTGPVQTAVFNAGTVLEIPTALDCYGNASLVMVGSGSFSINGGTPYVLDKSKNFLNVIPVFPSTHIIRVTFTTSFRLYGFFYLAGSLTSNVDIVTPGPWQIGAKCKPEAVARLVAGEHVCSFRSLLKIFRPIDTNESGSGWQVATLYTMDAWSPDLFTLLGLTFLGVRGSMNYLYQPIVQNDTHVTSYITRGSRHINVSGSQLSNGFSIVDSRHSHSIIVNHPFYCQESFVTLRSVTTQTIRPNNTPTRVWINNSESPLNAAFSKQAQSIGEDFSVVQYIGVPVLTLP